MKKVIRLTESDLVRLVKKVINEQLTAIETLSSLPETGQDVVGVDPVTAMNSLGRRCQTYKSSKELILELFSKLRGVSGQPSQTDKTIQSWVQRLKNSISGIGASNDLTKVFNEIKTPQQMGAVLNTYNKKFGKTLTDELGGELTVSWDTIWKLVKKFSTGIKIEPCKKQAGNLMA